MAGLAAGGVSPVVEVVQHCRWVHDQEHLPEMVTAEHLGQHSENRTVRVIEGWARYVPLQTSAAGDAALDRGVAAVAAGQ